MLARHESSRWRTSAGWSARLVIALSVLLAGGAAAAQVALAGAPLQRGDVLGSAGAAGLVEYAPSGQLEQTIPGAAVDCIDPSGGHLIAPGVGLFDSSGNPLPSSWAAVTPGRCVADGFGNVYVAEVVNSDWTVLKYGIRGNLAKTFHLTTFSGLGPVSIALAPDECTIYYGEWNEPDTYLGVETGIGRFNVCTNTQEPLFNTDRFVDDLRVLPNWEVLTTDDGDASLYDSSGNFIRSYNPGFNDQNLRTLNLDPDGTSFWVCCTALSGMTDNEVFRFDISSGQLLAAWAPGAGGPVYGPPLLGNANVEGTVDSDAPGTAEAFRTQAGYSGEMSSLHLWVDSSSTAGQVVVGVYSDNNGQPGSLQEQATITNVMAGSWNYVTLPSTVPVTASRRYWIALLGPSGGGTIRFRDIAGVRSSETSAQHNLTALPAKWSTGKSWASTLLSAYGS